MAMVRREQACFWTKHPSLLSFKNAPPEPAGHFRQLRNWNRKMLHSILNLPAQLPAAPEDDQVGAVLAVIAAGVAGALIALVALVRWSRRLRCRPAMSAVDLTLDVEALPTEGPPAAGPQLTFFSLPVRLAALVLAPVGRDSRLPAEEDLEAIVDQLVPGLVEVLAAHQPVFRRWPPQVSTQGFMKAFFGNVVLPGNRGRGTPWCGVVGKFEADGQPYLAGLVCRAERPNSFGQVVIEKLGGWLDVLQVRNL